MPYADPARKREYNKRYNSANREKLRAPAAERQRKFRANSPEKAAAAQQRYRDADKKRDATLQRRYGLTLEQYNDMLRAQGGRCAICTTAQPRGKGVFHVDHCHTSGAIRGLLCSECNTGLGKFKDSQETLLTAIEYLNAANARAACSAQAAA